MSYEVKSSHFSIKSNKYRYLIKQSPLRLNSYTFEQKHGDLCQENYQSENELLFWLSSGDNFLYG